MVRCSLRSSNGNQLNLQLPFSIRRVSPSFLCQPCFQFGMHGFRCRILKKRLLQKPRGIFSNKVPGELCWGFIGGFFGPFSLEKTGGRNPPQKIPGNIQIRIWEFRGQNPHCKNLPLTNSNRNKINSDLSKCNSDRSDSKSQRRSTNVRGGLGQFFISWKRGASSSCLHSAYCQAFFQEKVRNTPSLPRIEGPPPHATSLHPFCGRTVPTKRITPGHETNTELICQE